MDAQVILDVLLHKYRDRICAPELPFSGGQRRIDLWTLHPHTSQGYRSTCFEIKVSKADYKKDGYEKQRQARLFSDQFYYVTPKGLLEKSQIPDWAGLMEYDGNRFREILNAPVTGRAEPSWQLITSIFRSEVGVRRDQTMIEKNLRIRLNSYENKNEDKNPIITRSMASAILHHLERLGAFDETSDELDSIRWRLQEIKDKNL